ncbi:hypothetical protein XPN_1557, partial [Xanthomonas arboricola pv. pruni MAFF 301427]
SRSPAALPRASSRRQPACWRPLLPRRPRPRPVRRRHRIRSRIRIPPCRHAHGRARRCPAPAKVRSMPASAKADKAPRSIRSSLRRRVSPVPRPTGRCRCSRRRI